MKLVMAAILLTGSAQAAKPKQESGPRELRVAADGSGDYKKLSKALKAAKPGDLVLIQKPAGMVGLEVKLDERQRLVAVRALPGSPAEAAGVKAGEVITRIDGAPVTGVLLENVARLRGPTGTSVTLTLAPEDGSAPRDVVIARGMTRYEVKDETTKLVIARLEEDYEAAHDIALKLAEGGHVPAQTYLAFEFSEGENVRRDLRKAFAWAEKAAQAGDAAAQRLFAHFHNPQGPVVVKPNEELFVYWIRQAAQKGDAQALVNLSWCQENGRGMPKDLRAALESARRAEAQARNSDVAAGAQAAIARLEPQVPDAPKPAPVVAARPAPVTAPAPAAADELAVLPPARPADPKAVAVVIGVERHRESLPKADFAAADARMVAEYFKRMLGVPEENLALLLDDRATKSDFEKYFEQWLPNHAEPGSKVYVYFSGHGAPEPARGDSYLVPYDADPTYIKQTGYPLKRLYSALSKLPSKSVVVAMDSCFSGAGGRSVVAKGARPLVTVKADAPPAGITVIAASAGDQISSSFHEKGHGLFTYFLLKGLKEKDGDLRAAFDYLAPEVSRAARRRYNADQTPQWRQGP